MLICSINRFLLSVLGLLIKFKFKRVSKQLDYILVLDIEGDVFASALLEAIGDGLDGIQNRYVLSLLLDVGHVPQLVGHSTPEHGWESQLHLLPDVEIEHVRGNAPTVESLSSINDQEDCLSEVRLEVRHAVTYLVIHIPVVLHR